MNKMALLLITLLMTGCASFQASIPADYSGPTATIKDSYSDHQGSTAHFYVMTNIYGKLIEDSSYRTRVINSGRGFNMTPQMVSRQVTVEPHLFTIMGFVQFATDGQAMFGDLMLVKKTIELTPVAGETYTVNGKLATKGSDVWLEDTKGNKFTAELTTK